MKYYSPIDIPIRRLRLWISMDIPTWLFPKSYPIVSMPTRKSMNKSNQPIKGLAENICASMMLDAIR
jgi:hypothetical protein